jgi:hypothetical protein
MNSRMKLLAGTPRALAPSNLLPAGWQHARVAAVKVLSILTSCGVADELRHLAPTPRCVCVGPLCRGE